MTTKRQFIDAHVGRYIDGEDAAGDAICASLEPALRAVVGSLLSPDDADGDDVVQESLIAMLTYLRRTKIAPDNLEAFAVTIARNRCLNLCLWRRRRAAVDIDEVSDALPHIAASALDLVDQRQRREMLAQTLHSLDARCRELLWAIYRDEISIEEIRRKLGLKTVQAVYYRRSVCIKKAQSFLNRRLFSGLPIEGTKLGRIAAQGERMEDRDG